MPLLKLLVVEDDPGSLELMAALLTALNTKVYPISDSRRAAVLMNEEKFDGIFLDIEMPGLNGFELARLIRQSSRNKTTPIVIVTGREERDTMHQSFALGATFFLQKPIDRVKLTMLLNTVHGPLQETRRRYTRASMQTEVTCRVGTRSLKGLSWNISQGGMQLEVQGLALRDTVQVTFMLPKPRVWIEAIGVVAWAEGERQGIHFTDMKVEYQAVVRDFIEQVETSPPR
jgi:CheY-like chemotaxis protein